MEPRYLVASVLLLVLFLGPDFGEAQTLRSYRNRNGVRLSGDSGSRGRLEVSSVDAWFTATPGKPSWSPVCDSPSFSDNDALVMCRMLNYTYGRKYYSPLIAYRKNETCYLKAGPCDSRGPFVGIECSHTLFETTNPPPPSPPSPPPAPPAVSNSIRFYGPYMNQYTRAVGEVEPNLADYGNGLGSFYGRFEVQVIVNGSSVWAPLCGLPDGVPEYDLFQLGNIACSQLLDWPKPFDGGVAIVFPQVSFVPFNIPDAAVNPGDFDPDKVAAWVAAVSPVGSALSIQDLDIKITLEPCESGTLFAVACMAYGERRRS
ncbi:hypothetical protein VOLCADRAFT_108496 [Volvox carteri f. nagariensis]|uniref:SRCR domain-containing protein n=1 Tax=Volvox carteri f. nagariensis TaxID=3068 RepID=D8UKG2_VOLCA|nr:uncharacterized protein VOLCADRAFT_108496 [Volvox carteri f. nagariensis]EFJ39777.1 hypothetical protein VOLCADRAFT_108496 [Volvox carteri f. nagariensis]|eukprot:XP_002959154.1 hypothetical protein VOLCADRAFT_108496 [Volvox carteri f. nagariensis]